MDCVEEQQQIQDFPLESFRALYETLGESAKEYRERHFRYADEPGGRYVLGYELGSYRSTTIYVVGNGEPGESDNMVARVAPGWSFEEVFQREDALERERLFGPCPEIEVK